jgi:hypothetical protein
MQTIVIYGLAVFWLSVALSNKDGPGNTLKNLRDTLNLYLGSWSPLDCVFCSSFWVLAFFGLLFYYIPGVVYFFAILGAASVFKGLAQEF